MLGGGQVKFVCRPVADTARASKATGADGLILSYRVVAPIVETEGEGEQAVTVIKRPDFTDPDDGTTKVVQTKAMFTIDFGAANAGYILQFYARWINSKHPTLAGPWTGPYSEAIS
jgi:hypothetical protein